MVDWIRAEKFFSFDEYTRELGWRSWSEDLQTMIGLPSYVKTREPVTTIPPFQRFDYYNLFWQPAHLNADDIPDLAVVTVSLQGYTQPFNIYDILAYCGQDGDAEPARYRICGIVSYYRRHPDVSYVFPWAGERVEPPTRASVTDALFLLSPGGDGADSIIALGKSKYRYQQYGEDKDIFACDVWTLGEDRLQLTIEGE